MKKYILITISVISFIFISCNKNDDEKDLGNPTIDLKSQFSQAFFGDSLPFNVSLSDNVPLSTLKVDLFFGDEIVSTKTIRTKEDGDYSGKIFVPFYANIPDGTATLRFTLTNINLGQASQEVDLPVSRPIFPYLILVASDQTEYIMEPTDEQYNYSASAMFPTDLFAYIKTPAYGDNGNEITFGWNGSTIEQQLSDNIPFVSAVGGAYNVTFNTKTYKGSPFLIVKINDTEMTRNGDNFSADLDLTSGDDLIISGISDIDTWWIDPDWFTVSGDNSHLVFKPIAGKYRITADFGNKWFRVETMDGDDLATLSDDGSGAIWIIGENIGKPSLANAVGWTPGNGLCMVPEGNGKYHITLVAGADTDPDANVDSQTINFKFFYQKDWGGEFDSPALTSTSDLVFVGDGTAMDYQGNTRDNGNLGLLQPLEDGATYIFTVDVSAGNSNAVLSVVKL